MTLVPTRILLWAAVGNLKLQLLQNEAVIHLLSNTDWAKKRI